MKKFFNIRQIKKHFKKGLTPLLCALTVFNLVSIEAQAVTILTFPFPEPVTNEYSGYLLARRGASGIYYCFFYNFVPMYIDGDDPNDYQNQGAAKSLDIIPSLDTSKINLHFSFSPFVSGHFTLYEWNSYSQEVNYIYYELFHDGTNYGYDVNFYEPLDYIYANGSSFINSQFRDCKTGLDFPISWGDDYSIIYYISVIQSQLNSMNSNLNAINGHFITSNNYLDELVEVQDKIYGNTATIKDDVSIIKGALTSESEGSIQDVSSSGITSVENKENALVGTNASTSELSVNINPLASSVVWNLVDTVVTSNAKVFTMFISILTIAVIGLILNR